MTRGTRLFLLLLTACVWSTLAVGVARAQDSVRLREAVSRPLPGSITLADVAELTGDEAAKLAGVVVQADAAPGETSISIAAVRVLLEARDDVNWGRLELRGGTCRVSIGAPEPAKPQPARAKPAAAPVEIPSGPIVRTLVADRIMAALKAPAADLRLTFDERDAGLLNTSVVGRTSDITLVGTAASQPVSVTLYEGERIVASGTVRVGVQVRRFAAVLTDDVGRGDALTPASVAGEERWLPHTIDCLTPEDAQGRVARAAFPRGKVIEATDVQAPLVVKKGELVRVHCVNGSFVVKTTARALADARLGESVTLQPVGSNRTFQARMDAPGIAVLTSTGNDDTLAPGTREAKTPATHRKAVRHTPTPDNADAATEARRERDHRALKYADLADQKLDKDQKAAAPSAATKKGDR